MNKTTMTIRMDDQVKKQAQELFSDLGLDMTTAINLFLKQSIREQGIPFSLTRKTPNVSTISAMEDVNQHHNLSKTFDSVEALMEDLNA